METETNTESVARVTDASRANNLPTGHVLVAGVTGSTDHELADLAGYCSRHWGYAVTRHSGDTATVHLWND